jgi:energy-converting hydrogenase A subunit M
MGVVVDFDLGETNASYTGIILEVLEMRDVLLCGRDEHPLEERHDRVEQAMRTCNAISLQD